MYTSEIYLTKLCLGILCVCTHDQDIGQLKKSIYKYICLKQTVSDPKDCTHTWKLTVSVLNWNVELSFHCYVPVFWHPTFICVKRFGL